MKKNLKLYIKAYKYMPERGQIVPISMLKADIPFYKATMPLYTELYV
jgi:hypothetical protein